MKVSVKTLAQEIAADVGLSQTKASQVVSQIFEVITQNMEEGHEVTIPDFGKFRRKDKAARQGRNPKTGEAMQIPAKSVPNFLPAKGLKERVNGG